MPDDFSRDQAAMDRAKHQLTAGAAKAQSAFTHDQLAAAGLARERSNGNGSGQGLTIEQAVAAGLISPQAFQQPQQPPQAMQEDPMDEIHRRAALDMERQRMEAIRQQPQQPLSYAPPAPIPMPPQDPMQAMLNQLLQQNAMLQQQVMQLVQQLANGGGQAPQQPVRQQPVRESQMTRDQAERALYSGHGLVG